MSLEGGREGGKGGEGRGWDGGEGRGGEGRGGEGRFRFRFRLILFCQHTTFSNSNVYKNNEIIKYADMEAPIKTSYGRYHRATR